MNIFHPFDLETWPRRKLFEFYRGFDSPVFNISIKIDAAALYRYARERGESFFLLSLYAILRAANAVPQMRQRIVDGVPGEFEKIAVMTPIMADDEMFRQAWCEYQPDFPRFKAEAEPEISAVRSSEQNQDGEYGEDFICASCSPWMHFESITQADYRFAQSIPILAWGKLEDGKIPVSVKLNHCFVDGLHTARFFTRMQQLFSAPETLWTDMMDRSDPPDR